MSNDQLPYTIPYDREFLGGGFVVPTPGLAPVSRAAALESGRLFDFIHYSVVMHQRRQLALFTAANLDGAAKVQIARKRLGASWQVDERVGFENQIADWGYGDGTALDRGHLVRREDVQWGASYKEARDAARSTFFYANAAPQHMNFNQDEWLDLEDYALDFAVKNAYRLCIFAGPILAEDDPTYDELPEELQYRTASKTWIPARFWKVIVLRQEAAGGDDLAALAFVMDQTKLWKDKEGARLRPFQVPLTQLEQQVGLDFGALRQVDELSLRARSRAGGDLQVEVTGPDALVLPSATRRGAGILARALRAGARSTEPSTARGASRRARMSDCGCGSAGADGRLSRLERQVASLTAALEVLAAPPAPTAVSASPRGVGAGGRRASSAAPAKPISVSYWRQLAAKLDGPARRRVETIAQSLETDPASLAAGERAAAASRLIARITGGSRHEWKSHPSCCCIGSEQGFFCTGVLVGPRTVLTAAHCAVDGAVVLPSRVFLGANRAGDPTGKTYRVRRGAVHPEYLRNQETSLPDADICVLELDRDVDTVFVPVPLATVGEVRNSERTFLVGFGNADAAGSAGFGLLRSVEVPMLAPEPDSAAGRTLGSGLGFSPATEFVGGSRGLKKDSCRGDSGGPAYILMDDGSWKLAGLTSRMTREAEAVCGDGGIYTIPDVYREWLRQGGFAVHAEVRS